MLVDRGVDWILGQSTKRIAFLGISFKSGTDDVRESPFVEMVERLLGKGRAIRIFDPNVQLARIIGANSEYLLQHLPHIAESDGGGSHRRSRLGRNNRGHDDRSDLREGDYRCPFRPDSARFCRSQRHQQRRC